MIYWGNNDLTSSHTHSRVVVIHKCTVDRRRMFVSQRKLFSSLHVVGLFAMYVLLLQTCVKGNDLPSWWRTKRVRRERFVTEALRKAASCRAILGLRGVAIASSRRY